MEADKDITGRAIPLYDFRKSGCETSLYSNRRSFSLARYPFLLNENAARVIIISEMAATIIRSIISGNSGPRGGSPPRSRTCLKISIPNVRGLMWESSHKTVGIEETGYMAPERKNMGMTRKFMMMLNPSKEVSLAAIKIPREVIQNETRIDAATTAMNCMSEIWMPRKGVRIIMITAWATDIKVPEIALPKTIDTAISVQRASPS